MTMRMSADDQFKFLLSCVKWSVNGKVDFQEVASECGVVSKGAAAKRYERMLKNHGIHPNGGPLDTPAPSREKSVTTPKVSKKRKCEDASGTIKQDEDEGRKPPTPKRPRNEQPHGIKQEPPPMTYPPYMFHPIMPPHGPYPPRPMPPYMHSGMPHGQPQYMQHLPHPPQPPYPMMPGMHNQHQFIMPLHQMQTFPIGQNMPPLSQDSSSIGPFDDFLNQDFGNASFEALLHGDSTATRMPNEVFQSETSSVPAVLSKTQHTSADLQLGKDSSRIKDEPCQSPPSPVRDDGSANELVVLPLSVQTSPSDLLSVPNSVDLDGQAAPTTAIATVSHPSGTESTLPFKQENDESCIFISD